MDNTTTLDELKSALVQNFSYFAENTLAIIHDKSEDKTIEIFQMFTQPHGVTYLFIFITAACEKYGYTDIDDKVQVIKSVLETVYRVPEENSFSLIDISLSYATTSTKDALANKRTMLSMVNQYANHAGGKFVPGESHIDFLNMYTLIILSSSIDEPNHI